eukprot:11172530-Prorocentrum_lima.AAC.1
MPVLSEMRRGAGSKRNGGEEADGGAGLTSMSGAVACLERKPAPKKIGIAVVQEGRWQQQAEAIGIGHVGFMAEVVKGQL